MTYNDAIETIQDMLDVMEAAGSCYVYKHNGGDIRLKNVLECLRAQQKLESSLKALESNEPPTLDAHSGAAGRRMIMDEIKDYPPYLDYPKPYKAQTNADRIRAMSDEELAVWLCGLFSAFTCYTHCPGCDSCNDADGKSNGLKKWLKQTAEKGNNDGQ